MDNRHGSSPRLILFDIDGTILHTNGVSKQIFCRALSEVFGAYIRWENIPYQGQPDRALARQLLAHHGHININDWQLGVAFERMGALWAEHPPGQDIVVYPGIRRLVAGLASENRVCVGQLTANARPAALGKLRAAGFETSLFPTGGYGDDAEERNDLLPIALSRCEGWFNHSFKSADTTIIGDSPADIICARQGGARVVAVATGRYAVAELAAYRPDLLIANIDSGWDELQSFL